MTVTSPSITSLIPAPPARVKRGLLLPWRTKRGVRFNVNLYLKMDRSGLFDDARTELVFGRIYKMHAQANPHRWCISKGNRLLPPLFAPDRFWLVGQGTLFLGKYGAPEPDFHAFDVPEGTADEKLPVPFLVIEVSDSTYRRDTGPKLRQYAAAGVPDYWVVNLKERRIEVYRSPLAPAGPRGRWGYSESTHYSAGQTVSALRHSSVQVAVNDLLP